MIYDHTQLANSAAQQFYIPASFGVSAAF
jgi:hypothetical protein